MDLWRRLANLHRAAIADYEVQLADYYGARLSLAAGGSRRRDLDALRASAILPSLLKFLLICVVLTGFLLLTYDKLVRYAWLGTLLNGPRTRPEKPMPSTSP